MKAKKLKHVHYEPDFLDFVKSEARRRDISEAEIIREIVRLGEPKYRTKHKVGK